MLVLNPRLITSCVVAIILSLCTVVLFGVMIAHRAVGPDLVKGGDFESTQDWRLSRSLRERASLISDGVIKLEAKTVGEDLLARQRLDIPESRQVLVIASGVEILVDDPEAEPSSLPTIALVGRDRAGQLVGGFDNVVARHARDMTIGSVSKYVQLPADHTELWLELEISGSKGFLSVDRLSAFEAQPITWILWTRKALAALWFSLLVYTLFFLWKVSKLGSIGFLGIGLLTIVLPSPWEWIALGETRALASVLLDWGFDHGILFFLGTLASYQLFSRDNHWATLLCWFALASSTESLQFFTSTRIPLVSDWIANVVGIVAAVFVVVGYQFWHSTRTV